MTGEALVWETSEVSFSEKEDVMTGFRGEFIINETITRGQSIINPLSTGKENEVDFTDDQNLFDVLNDKVNVTIIGVLKGEHGVTSEYLSQKWLISPSGQDNSTTHYSVTHQDDHVPVLIMAIKNK